MTAILAGAEPLSHVGTSTTGVLVLHGFTGNPSSMRAIADAMAGLGYHVELPLLPGHGTVVDDMLDTGWADWSGSGRGGLPAPRRRGSSTWSSPG